MEALGFGAFGLLAEPHLEVQSEAFRKISLPHGRLRGTSQNSTRSESSQLKEKTISSVYS